MKSTFFELASTRRSIRKFTDKKIPVEDIEYFVNTAITAPSGCNSQCWHFTAVTSQDLISTISDAVISATKKFYTSTQLETTDEFLNSRAKSTSFFKNAPLVMFVFTNKVNDYDERVTEFFKAEGHNYRQMMDCLAYPDVLSIGAAIENMLLAIHEKGYGACWMNDPIIAEKEIKQLLDIQDDSRLISVIPIGEAAYKPRSKVLKPLSQILDIR